jgi:DNA-binding MarR family transcriptional regulator
MPQRVTGVRQNRKLLPHWKFRSHTMKKAKKAPRTSSSRVRPRASAVSRSEGARDLGVNVDLGMMRESIAFQLRYVSWAVHSAFIARFAPSDAVPRQYSVLYLININRGISVKALAAAIGVDQSTLVPTLNVCEDSGWIRRVRGQVDRRLVALNITAKGGEILDEMREMLRSHEASVTSELNEAERRQLLALLRKVRKGTLSTD